MREWPEPIEVGEGHAGGASEGADGEKLERPRDGAMGACEIGLGQDGGASPAPRQKSSQDVRWNDSGEAYGEYGGPSRTDHLVEEGNPGVHDRITRPQAWRVALRKQRAPGADCLPAFWLRAFPKASEKLINEVDLGNARRRAGNPRVAGVGEDGEEGCSGRPNQYRPITCLDTTYKLLTRVAAEILMDHVVRKNLLPEEQALIIDRAAVREAREGKGDMD